MGESFIITAIPNENSYNTTFEFEYYSDGEAHPAIVRFYNAMFVVPENGPTMLIVAIVILSLIMIACCCFSLMFIRKRLHKDAMPNEGKHELVENDFSNSKNMDDADQTGHEGDQND